VINRFVQQALQREVEATTERVEIGLDLTSQTLQINNALPISFAEIDDFRLVTDIGISHEPQEEMTPMVQLIMTTSQGQLTVLPKALGTGQLKMQLASELKTLTKGNRRTTNDS
jgi:hypothetical protein